MRTLIASLAPPGEPLNSLLFLFVYIVSIVLVPVIIVIPGSRKQPLSFQRAGYRVIVSFLFSFMPVKKFKDLHVNSVAIKDLLLSYLIKRMPIELL
jgi:hypothetical protein